MSSRLTKPTKVEVDSLAAFIEAAEELLLGIMGKIITALSVIAFTSAPHW